MTRFEVFGGRMVVGFRVLLGLSLLGVGGCAPAVVGDDACAQDASAPGCTSEGTHNEFAEGRPGCHLDDATACEAGEYCRFTRETCGSGGLTGVCMPIPSACDEENDNGTYSFSPICGCDGVTYATECDAARAGQSLLVKGDCP